MNERGRPVVIVRACLRDGSGGSPTAVVIETPLSDDERRRVPVLLGTSHAVFVLVNDGAVALRFFTARGELAACGHGTIAALAFLADRAASAEYQVTLHTSERVFSGRAVREKTQVKATFEPGHIDLRETTDAEADLILPALGIASDTVVAGTCVASPGRPRLLVPVGSRSDLAALDPDFDRLANACDRLGLLGCYVYSAPTPTGRLAARMFAPAIGVAEDIANANSTACLAAHLVGHRFPGITVDMGDSLGSPATITATARRSPSGTVVRLGGVAEVTKVVRL
jgi:PhzF family phenazine biosynthesis protein